MEKQNPNVRGRAEKMVLGSKTAPVTVQLESIEEGQMFFYFDIRHKYPKSEELYEKRGDTEAISGIENPFKMLNGKKILHNVSEIGVLRVRDGIFPQCLSAADGTRDCGWFFQVETEVGAKIDISTATEAVVGAIGNSNLIDHLEIEECTKLKSGHGSRYEVQKSHNIDPKTLRR